MKNLRLSIYCFGLTGLFVLVVQIVEFNQSAYANERYCKDLYAEGESALQQANYEIALERFIAAQNCLLKQSKGKETGETATCIESIGRVYEIQGNYEKALENYNIALATRSKLLGEYYPDTAASYDEIGVVYYMQSDYQKALDYHNKALKIRIEVLGENHIDTATSYNNIGRVYFKQSDYQKALDYHNKALKIRIEVLGENHIDTATIYSNIGVVYDQHGDYGRAIEYHKKALSIRLTVLGEKHIDTANSYSNIGVVYYERGDFENALENFSKALEIMLKAYGDEHPSIATIYSNIASIYNDRGYYDKALDNDKKALDIRLKIFGENHPDTALSYNNIGTTYYNQDDFERALWNFNKALEIRLKVYGDEHLSIATSYSNIGVIHDELGDFEKALDSHKKALAIKLKLLGEIHPNIAVSYNNIGAVYDSRNDYMQALENYTKALGIRLKVFGEDHPDTAISYNNIGYAYMEKSDYAKALEYFNKALGIRLKAFGENHPDIAACYRNIGKVYYELDDIERALDNFNKMIGSLCEGKQNPSAADCRSEMISVDAFRHKGKTLYKAFQKTGNPDVESKLISDSASAYENAATALNRLRKAVQSEESKKFHSGKYYEMFPEGVGVFAELAEKTGDNSSYERAFEFAETGIGRVFMEMLARSRALVDGGLPTDVIQEGVNLKEKWWSALESVRKIESQPKDKQSQSERKAVYEQLQISETELEDYEERLLHYYPEYAELMRPRIRSLSEIREKLIAADEAVLAYVLGVDGSFLIFITKSRIKIEALPKSHEIEGKIKIFRTLLNSAAGDIRKVKKDGADLFEMLIKPVTEDLSGINKLLIIPTGELYFLPFEALTMEGGGETSFLIEKYEIRYAPSLNVLFLAESRNRNKRDEERRKEGILGFGDPVYDEKDGRAGNRVVGAETKDMIDSYSRAMSTGNSTSSSIWHRIPGTGEEVKAIQEVVGKSSRIELGLDASENNFKHLSIQGYRFIHIASHGTLGEGGAKQPALILSLVGNEGTGEDGILTMTEVINSKTPADMIVLSACKTGQGKMEKGEGVAGMSRAFLYSGADSLVVSLWSVADKETKDLMVDFYKKMHGGMNRESALREAKLDMIKKGHHPYYWAPFVYIGIN